MPSASATSSTPRATAAALCPRLSSASASSARTVLITSCVSGSWKERAGERAEARGPVLARVEAGERDATGEVPAVEVRHEAAGGAQQRRLAVPGEPREQAELAAARSRC